METAETLRFSSPPREAALLRRVALGDEAAIAEFHEAYANLVFRFIYRRVQERREDAEEITQDVFLVAVNCAATFDDTCAVPTWLCGIAKLRIADFYRRRGRLKRIADDKLTPFNTQTLEPCETGSEHHVDEAIARLEAARLVDRMLATLTADEREALVLRYVEEFSVREIAALLRRSEKAIESLLMRAKKKALHAARELGE